MIFGLGNRQNMKEDMSLSNLGTVAFHAAKVPTNVFSSSLICLLTLDYVVQEDINQSIYSKTCLKRPLKKKIKIGFQDKLSLNAGQKYCRMLQGEHSAILSTFIKLPFVN